MHNFFIIILNVHLLNQTFFQFLDLTKSNSSPFSDRKDMGMNRGFLTRVDLFSKFLVCLFDCFVFGVYIIMLGIFFFFFFF